MSENWSGVKYILEENGDKLLFKASNHYRKRLTKIDSDPSVKALGGSFGMLLNQEAHKTFNAVNPVIEKIASRDAEKINSLQSDISILEKALNCYKSDIQKIVSNMENQYAELFDEPKTMKNDLPLIDEALSKILLK